MTRDEAQAECARLAKEHPDRETHRFIPRQGPGDSWSVAKVGLPPISGRLPTGEIRGNQKPPSSGGGGGGL